MRRYKLTLLTFCLLFSSCAKNKVTADGGTLTNERAEQTLRKWMPGSNATVTGVQEIPQQNVATVNVMFSNFSFTRSERVFNEDRHEFVDGWVPKTYSGPGVANFVHYNDGRWMLTRVVTSQGAQSTHWDELSVEAP